METMHPGEQEARFNPEEAVPVRDAATRFFGKENESPEETEQQVADMLLSMTPQEVLEFRRLFEDAGVPVQKFDALARRARSDMETTEVKIKEEIFKDERDRPDHPMTAPHPEQSSQIN